MYERDRVTLFEKLHDDGLIMWNLTDEQYDAIHRENREAFLENRPVDIHHQWFFLETNTWSCFVRATDMVRFYDAVEKFYKPHHAGDHNSINKLAVPRYALEHETLVSWNYGEAFDLLRRSVGNDIDRLDNIMIVFMDRWLLNRVVQGDECTQSALCTETEFSCADS